MRETITVFICILIFIIALQTGVIRTGLDYAALERKCETLQIANDRLGQEIKRLAAQSRQELAAPDTNLAERMQKVVEDLQRQLEKEIDSGDVVLRDMNGWPVMGIQEYMLFTKRSLQLKKSAHIPLLKIAQIFGRLPEVEILITGYTDNVPLSPALRETYPTHRRFSMAQAATVAEFLEVNSKLDPSQIRIAGFGYYRPRVANDSALHRSLNCYIEIALCPADREILAKAREILVNENTSTVHDESNKAQPQSTAPAEENSQEGAGEVIGEDALDSMDGSDFDAGYDQPKY